MTSSVLICRFLWLLLVERDATAWLETLKFCLELFLFKKNILSTRMYRYVLKMLMVSFHLPVLSHYTGFISMHTLLNNSFTQTMPSQRILNRREIISVAANTNFI